MKKTCMFSVPWLTAETHLLAIHWSLVLLNFHAFRCVIHTVQAIEIPWFFHDIPMAQMSWVFNGHSMAFRRWEFHRKINGINSDHGFSMEVCCSINELSMSWRTIDLLIILGLYAFESNPVGDNRAAPKMSQNKQETWACEIRVELDFTPTYTVCMKHVNAACQYCNECFLCSYFIFSTQWLSWWCGPVGCCDGLYTHWTRGKCGSKLAHWAVVSVIAAGHDVKLDIDVIRNCHTDLITTISRLPC